MCTYRDKYILVHHGTHTPRSQPLFTSNQALSESALRRRRVSQPRLSLSSCAAFFLSVVSLTVRPPRRDFDVDRDYADQCPLTDMDMDSSSRNWGRHQASIATVEAHALLRTFGCIEWECALYSGRPKMEWYELWYHSHDIIVSITAYDNQYHTCDI
jgi:hypothetical protein